MYFIREGERYRQSEAPVPGWVFELRPPLIECNGEEETMTREAVHFRGAGFLATEQIEDLGGGLFAVERQLVNDGVGTRRFKLIMEGITGFIPEKYTIPCVSYDGNRRSGGHEPQGTAVEGRNWIFAYDRSGIPSCTVTENRAHVAAMFASDRGGGDVCLGPGGGEPAQLLFTGGDRGGAFPAPDLLSGHGSPVHLFRPRCDERTL